jgi:hypothetical protein
VVEPAGRSNLYALPRISWDGRLRSLRAMRVMLSGAMLPRPPVLAPASGQLGDEPGSHPTHEN